MSPNSDSAIARLLFAILKQKDLRDIDWNQVAADPVLVEPITNGHAARMRYSRFRATVNGHTASKRARPSEKARAAKVKKGVQTKKDKPIKPEPGSASLSSYPQFSPDSLSSLASPYMGGCDDLGARFLTPCSDDMTQGLTVPPSALQHVRHTSGLMFPPLDDESDLMNLASRDHNVISHSPATLPTFDVAFDLSYAAGDIDSQDLSHSGGSQPLGDWDDRLHDQLI
ncbi:hypothetical protein Trco_000250 [Trichoderma cornu-damae]|uniref:Myb-like DNA-binding domain-containing protein n=1 Tax=Trichoderma cornu-damae TaxID=654480 RepID=A0A9P8QV10_9HYPO|nr:hypothetical protein Trco_000250 [Trichoderma cornu-damae]